MVGDNVLDDGKTQPGSTGHARTGRIHSIKTLKDAVEVRLGDSDALIGHANLNLVFVGAGGDRHARSLWAVRDGVGHQVAQSGH